MSHDPLCPVVTITKVIDCVIVLPGTDISTTNLGKTIEYEEGECLCDLIAKVREDERDNAWSSVAEIHAIELWDGVKTAWWIVKADALTAIEATKGVKP